ncbi:MAG: FAD/NAD(P)-binding oxidoreductase [Pseudomonadota bacterium]
MEHVIIVGAGQAGSSCAFKLRNLGFTGEITLIGAEDAPPYQRPPLSKKYLLGEMELERLYLRPQDLYAAEKITLRTRTEVSKIDASSKQVFLGNDALNYTDLVLTTGSFPNRLPSAIGGDLAGVFTVRDLNDVDAMAPEFKAGARVLIVGGGYIGLEAAAVAAAKGLKVIVVEMSERILQRVASPQTSDYFRALHEGHGVEIKEGLGLASLQGEGRVAQAVLSDDTIIDVDFVIVGIGIKPATSLAEAAGLQIENGIKTDAQGRTSDQNIWAAGDCASFPYQGQRIRLESVPNAIEQAECVAENIMGANKDYVAKPWFWSDQYDVKLQIAGLNTGYDQVVSRIGDGATASFWYYRDGQLIAVDAANDARGYMIGKRMIENGQTPDPAPISDPATDLKSLLA